MTREELKDLLSLVAGMFKVAGGAKSAKAQAEDFQAFADRHITPLEIAAAIQSALAKGPIDNPPMSGWTPGTLDDFQPVPDQELDQDGMIPLNIALPASGGWFPPAGAPCPMPTSADQDSLPTAADVRGILRPGSDAVPWVCMICRTARARGWLVMKIHSIESPRITCFQCAEALCTSNNLFGGYLSFDTIDGLADDAELSAICDGRAGMPSVAVNIDDL